MINYTINSLLKNKLILVWPISVVLIFFMILIFGTIQTYPTGFFQINFGTVEIRGSFFISQLLTLISFICIVALPHELCQMLHPHRAALIFSKPISRFTFIYENIAGVFTVTLMFSALTSILLGVLLYLKIGLYLNLLFYILISIPIIILTLYTTILLLAILTNQYAICVFGTIIINLVISPFIMIFPDLFPLYNNSLLSIQTLVDILLFVIPNTMGAFVIDNTIFKTEYSDIIDIIMLFYSINHLKILLSCIPFLLLSIYFIQKKQF